MFASQKPTTRATNADEFYDAVSSLCRTLACDTYSADAVGRGFDTCRLALAELELAAPDTAVVASVLRYAERIAASCPSGARLELIQMAGRVNRSLRGENARPR